MRKFLYSSTSLNVVSKYRFIEAFTDGPNDPVLVPWLPWSRATQSAGLCLGLPPARGMQPYHANHDGITSSACCSSGSFLAASPAPRGFSEFAFPALEMARQCCAPHFRTFRRQCGWNSEVVWLQMRSRRRSVC